MNATHTTPTSTHAIVIGGSVAGLFAARVLSDRFDRVTIVERDELPNGAEYRPGVPQAHHLHVLLVKGQHIAEELFPGFAEDMRSAGCERGEWGDVNQFLVTGGWTPRFNSGIFGNIGGRVTVEWLIRRRVEALPNVQFLTGREVEGLLADATKSTVTGVQLQVRADKSTETHTADLVVDASGRRSKAPDWLAALGYAAPETTIINAHTGYATRWFKKSPSLNLDLKAVLVQPRPADKLYRGAAYMVTEDDKVVVTLLGANHDYPPTDEAGFLEFARSLPSPIIYDLVRQAKPISMIYGYRKLENQERHYERLSRRPENFITTGDAAVALNPIYGQGMTSAAVEALALRDLLQTADPRNLRGLAAKFQRRLHKVTRGAWLMSTSEDMRYPDVEGANRGPMVRLINRYFDMVAMAMPYDIVITKAFIEAMAMLKSPAAALMRPDVMLRVYRHALFGHRDQSQTKLHEPKVALQPVEA